MCPQVQEKCQDRKLVSLGWDRRRVSKRQTDLFCHCFYVVLALILWLHQSSSVRADSDSDSDDGYYPRMDSKMSPAMRRFLQDSTISPGLQEDRKVLLDWKAHFLGQPNQNVNATLFFGAWRDSDPTPCSWPGIVCEDYENQFRVTQINLQSQQLNGVLPETGYDNFTAVTSLILAINNLNGTIPDAIGYMPNLVFLDLAQNILTGGIPDSFGDLMGRVVSLNVSVNGLSLPLSDTLFASCPNLVVLNVSRNVLPGNLPNIGNCQKLEFVDFWKNHLTGHLPPELGLVQSLKKIVLSETYIEGSIPASFFANCGNLQTVQFARMRLSGPLPTEIGSCLTMKLFNVQSNNMSGAIPAEIGLMKNLTLFAVGNNSFSGVLPDELGTLTGLMYLDLSRNQFEGTVPATFSALKLLRNLVLQENQLTGLFPAVVTQLPSLRLLDLSNNELYGEIPPEIYQLTNLTFLFLACNRFSGNISENVGSLVNLQVLDFSNNSLTGSIPASLGTLSKLLLLQLSSNMLSGEIPESLGNCSSLIWLNLGWNNISGPIPDSFELIGRLAVDTFRSNWVNLPLVSAEMGECGALSRWLPGNYPPYSFLISDLGTQGRQCRVWWNLLLKGQLHPVELNTPLAYMQLSYNQLNGPIPNAIGQQGGFSILFLDHNEISGPIPDLLDQLPLYNANFSHNMLTGSVPESIGLTKELLSLDLSYNQLSGKLPSSLANLTFLDKFNISYNNLSGSVPLTHQFATFPFTVYIGNPYLCWDGSPYASANARSRILSLCSTNGVMPPPSGPHSGSSDKKHLSPAMILAISIVTTLFVLLLLGIACFASTRRKYMRNAAGASSPEPGFGKVGRDRFHSNRDLLKIPVSAFGSDLLPKALAYVDLLVATNNFDDSNIIGDGGFGVVYRAKLAEGLVVAIKKLIQDGAQGEREFAAEMLTLGNIRHDNLVPLLGYCSSEHVKLLVYKCMTNGSLEEWLHDRPGGKEVLNWSKRLNIAAGAARGLAFLHHNCAPVIIHRDMKASNILLDDDYNACVTDFGLARRMYGQDTHVSTIVAGTLGYVPPEYSQTWRSTTKGDVYSFGVVLLELITGKRPTGIEYDDDTGCYVGGNLVEWVRILITKRKHEDAYDPIIKNSGASQELFQFLKLAIVCTEDIPSNRPAMSDVTKALDQIQLSLTKRSPAAAFL